MRSHTYCPAHLGDGHEREQKRITVTSLRRWELPRAEREAGIGSDFFKESNLPSNTNVSACLEQVTLSGGLTCECCSVRPPACPSPYPPSVSPLPYPAEYRRAAEREVACDL